MGFDQINDKQSVYFCIFTYKTNKSELGIVNFIEFINDFSHFIISSDRDYFTNLNIQRR